MTVFDFSSEIGRRSGPVTFEVDRHACRQYARAVGYTDKRYYDHRIAQAHGFRDIPAPIGFIGHPVFNPDAPSDGSLRLDVDLPFKRVLNGGTDIRYFADVCAGDVLIGTACLTDIAVKEGGSGTMVLLTIDESYERDGRLVATVRRTRILY